MAVDWDALASSLETELETCLSNNGAQQSFRSSEIILPAVLAQLVNQQSEIVTKLTAIETALNSLISTINDGVDVTIA